MEFHLLKTIDQIESERKRAVPTTPTTETTHAHNTKEKENEKATRRHNNYTNNNNDLKGFMHFISTQAVKHIKPACSRFSVVYFFSSSFYFNFVWDHQVNSDRQVSTSHSSK